MLNRQMLPFCIVFLCSLLLSALPSFSAPKYEGTFHNSGPLGETVIVLHESANGKVTGTFTNNATEFTVTASRKGDGIYGVVKGSDPDDVAYLDAKMNGATLSADLIRAGIGGEPDNDQKIHFDFTREGASAEPASPTTAKPSPKSPSAKSAVKKADGEKSRKETKSDASGWKIYKHPLGIFIKYPPSWSIKANDSGVQFLPPDPASDTSGPAEAYFVTGEAANGVTSIDDPRVVQTVQSTMAQMIPFLKMEGDAKHVPGGAEPGIVTKWVGVNPAGKPVLARIYSVILKGYAISVIAIGLEGAVEKRDTLVQKMFTSINAGEADLDERLVGRWRHWSFHSGAGGNLTSETEMHVVLRADGVCELRQRGETGATFQGATGENEGGMAGQNSSGNQGTWSASGGKLYIHWSDGSTLSYEYEFAGRQLNVRPIGSSDKPMEWMPE